MKLWKRLKNLWHIAAYDFEKSAGENLIMYDAMGNKRELKKTMSTMKKKLATIIPERSQLEESIIDEGGDIT